MSIHIRKAVKDDMYSVLDLIKELAIFEKEPDAVEVTQDDLMKDGFGEHPKFQCFVAEDSKAILGIALVYTRYSTWKGQVLHLEDLIVKHSHRGQGIGTKLLDEVIKYGKELHVKRVCWEVLDWNESAIEFYKSKGADVKRDWDVVHLNEQGIEQYIAQL